MCCAGRGPERARGVVWRAGMVVRARGRRGPRAAAPARLLAGPGRRRRRAGRHAAGLEPRRRGRGRRSRRLGRVRRLRAAAGRRPRRSHFWHPLAHRSYYCRRARRLPLSLPCLAAGQ